MGAARHKIKATGLGRATFDYQRDAHTGLNTDLTRSQSRSNDTLRGPEGRGDGAGDREGARTAGVSGGKPAGPETTTPPQRAGSYEWLQADRAAPAGLCQSRSHESEYGLTTLTPAESYGLIDAGISTPVTCSGCCGKFETIDQD